MDIDPLQRHSAGSIEDKTAEDRLSKQPNRRKQRLRQSRNKETPLLPSQVDPHACPLAKGERGQPRPQAKQP